MKQCITEQEIQMGSIKKVIYSGREFVNTQGNDDTGYIQAEIVWEYNYGFNDYEHDNDYDENGAPGEIDYKLKFADCNRIIDFNIYGNSKDNQDNAYRKIDKMIEVLSGFRKGLEEAFIAEEHIKNVNIEKRKKLEEKERKEKNE